MIIENSLNVQNSVETYVRVRYNGFKIKGGCSYNAASLGETRCV